MDKTFYKTLVLKHLSDDNFYVNLPENPNKNIMRDLKRLLKKYEHILKDKELDYLTKF